MQTGKLLRTLSGHVDTVLWLAFSSDGHVLASGGDDHIIKLWDMQTGKELCTLTGHAGSIYCLAFSTDGQMLASGGDDHTIKLWGMP